eukprot:1030245-Rhodomonas_salina.5
MSRNKYASESETCPQTFWQVLLAQHRHLPAVGIEHTSACNPLHDASYLIPSDQQAKYKDAKKEEAAVQF